MCKFHLDDDAGVYLQEASSMQDQSIILTGIAIFLLCLLGPGTAFATVKCQCNNGTLAHSMSADYDDADVEDSCNDACSSSGGGRVWSVDTDRNDNDSDNVNVRGGDRRPGGRPASPHR